MKTNTIIITIIVLCSLTLGSCRDSQKALVQRAGVLCHYIPDHQLLPEAKEYMTDDFYQVLDTMFNLEDAEPLAHEWLYYFVTGNGGSMADFQVTEVNKTDNSHAVAAISVKQIWEDGSFDPETDIETHTLYMEKQNGVWLMSDFDERKQDCINYIANYRREQQLRNTIAQYLNDSVAIHYSQGEISVPVTIFVAVEEAEDSLHARIYGDFWVFNYNISGDTLLTVSGGNHSGCMYIASQNNRLEVQKFEQVQDGALFTPSAKHIFGSHYDIFQNIHSNQDIREEIRTMQLKLFIRHHNLPLHYYKDYGWEAVRIG